MYIILNPLRARERTAPHEVAAVDLAQIITNSTRKASTIFYQDKEGVRTLYREVRPEKKQSAIVRRINERLFDFIEQGMSPDEARHALVAENMARFTA